MRIPLAIRCLGHIPGCDTCHTEKLRGADRHVCDDLCAMQAKVRADPAGHRRSHLPKFHDCGALLDDRHGNNYELVKFCGWGTCVQFCCPGCRQFVSGFGPLGCLCEDDPCGHGTYEELIPAAAPAATAKPSRLRALFRKRK